MMAKIVQGIEFGKEFSIFFRNYSKKTNTTMFHTKNLNRDLLFSTAKNNGKSKDVVKI